MTSSFRSTWLTVTLVAACFALLSPCKALSPSTTLTEADRERLQQVLQPGWLLQDLSLVLYAASGYKHLGIKLPDAQAACTYVKGFISSSNNPNTETIFLATSAAYHLGCPVALTPALKQTLQNSINEGSSLVELYHAVLGLHRLGLQADPTKTLAATTAALKRDDSVLNLGYAFHVAAKVTGGDVAVVFDRIEDALVQADEVDGRMLQFEGGLSITALVVDGVYQLCEASKRPIPVRPQQAVKFANYLLSRKSVQLPKGVHYLMLALHTLTTNKHHIPVSISLASSVSVSTDHPTVQVSVTDLLGNGIGEDVKVVADALTRDDDNTKIATNIDLTPLGQHKTVYSLDVMAMGPARGFHKLFITARGGDKRLVGNVAATLTIKVLTSISVDRVEFGTADADQSSPPTLELIPYGTKLPGGPVEADRHQKVVMRFIVTDTTTKQPTRVHQAFVRITHTTTSREIIFVAEPDASGPGYKFDMVVQSSMAELRGVSGVYSVELILGDASVANPLRWHLADLSLRFPDPEDENAETKPDYTYKSRPAISHLFQTAEPRPAAIISTAFTVLCVLPLVLLLALWRSLGVNLSNFPFTLTAVGFHFGIGSMFFLFYMFWLQLDMFTTLRYVFITGLFTFYCGNSMLSKIAAARKEFE